MAPGHRGSDRTIALGVFVALLLIQIPFRLIGISMLDEGAILQMSSDILQGRHLYRDAIHYAFPGVFYATAAAFGDRHYVFGDLVQRELSLPTRLAVTFTPRLTLETYLQPLIAATLGIFWLGEPLGAETIIAAVFIFSGVGVAVWNPARRAARAD